MKRFAYLPIVLFPIAAGADVTVYFDENNVCDGLCLVKPADGQCCPSGSLVTGLRVGARADATLSEIRVGNTTLFDTTGAIKSDGITALRTAAKNGTLGTDTKITGGYECVTGATKNKNDVCVYGIVDETKDYTYVDFKDGDIENGYEVLPENLVGGTRGSCMHSEFNLRIHWCPPKHGAYDGNWTNGKSGWNPDSNPVKPTGFEYPELWPEDCESGDIYTDVHYKWVNRQNASISCYDSINNTCKGTVDSGGNCRCAAYTEKGNIILDQLNVPSGKFADWTLRGFYLRNGDLWTPPDGCNGGTNQAYNEACFVYWGNRNYFAKWRVTTKNNTDGTARLGLPKNSTETGYIPLNDRDMDNWANTRWGIWDCSKTDEQVADTTYHLYAGWARNCEAGEGATCTLTVKRTGLSGNNDKGDVFYTGTCNDGSAPTGNSGSSYNPICNSTKNISYEYVKKYQTTTGTIVTCNGGPDGGTCPVGGSLTLAGSDTLSCGDGYVFYKWSTSGGLHDAGATIDCSYEELGSFDNAGISGVLCNCNDTNAVSSRVCQSLCPTPDAGKGPGDLQPAFTIDENLTEETN